jgi:hypothetical protein
MKVDRLERASKPGGYWGLSRFEVMDSMYGRMDPKPKGEVSELGFCNNRRLG